MRYLILSCALVIGFVTKAQDSTQIAEEIIALAQPFQNAESWYMEQEIVMLDEATEELLDREETVIYKSGNKQYSKQFSQEILLCEPYLIKVNNEEKEILVNSYSPKELNSFPLEEYFKMYEKLEYRETQTHKIYYLTLSELYIYKKAEIWVNKESGKLQKMSIYPKYPMQVKQKERTIKMDFLFTEINFKPSGLEKKLSPAQFFAKQGTDLKLKEAYQNYTLINHINL